MLVELIAVAGRPHLVTNAGDGSPTFLIRRSANTTTCRWFDWPRAIVGKQLNSLMVRNLF